MIKLTGTVSVKNNTFHDLKKCVAKTETISMDIKDIALSPIPEKNRETLKGREILL